MTSTALGVTFIFLTVLSDKIMVTDKHDDKKRKMEKSIGFKCSAYSLKYRLQYLFYRLNTGLFLTKIQSFYGLKNKKNTDYVRYVFSKCIKTLDSMIRWISHTSLLYLGP